MQERQDLRGRTKRYAVDIIRLYTSLPKREEARVIGRQMLRSGTSVGANYREAYRARSDAEFVSKVGICLQELDETGYWLELLEDAGIIPAQTLLRLKDETNQLIAIFTSIQKKVRSRAK